MESCTPATLVQERVLRGLAWFARLRLVFKCTKRGEAAGRERRKRHEFLLKNQRTTRACKITNNLKSTLNFVGASL